MSEWVIETRNLTKEFRRAQFKIPALKNADLHVQ